LKKNTLHLRNLSIESLAQGELVHKTDFFEWYGYVDIYRHLIQKILSIERKVGDELEEELLEFA